MGEFDLIDRYFKRPSHNAKRGQVSLGIGDDCALLSPAPGMQLALSTDMLVEGRHFFSNFDPSALGHKALAVNLSDLAACGAKPLAFSLALALPRVDEAWLAGFSRGLFALADAHGCELIGGDTTQGPLNICITVYGEVPAGQALLRSGARAGDDVYVSGTVGDARLALEVFRGRISVPPEVFDAARARLEQPTPRVALGQALRQSGVGARIEAAQAVQLLAAGANGATALSTDTQLELVFAGGDDYELVFTAPPCSTHSVQAAAASSDTPVTRIGRIEPETGLRLVDAQGALLQRHYASFDHFA